MFRFPVRIVLLSILLLSALLWLWGCGSNGPVSPVGNDKPSASNAMVLFDGQAASGVLPVPRGASAAQPSTPPVMRLSVRFQEAGDGTPIDSGVCDYGHHGRGSMGGMMDHNGRFMLYDDGTHGDPMPHDGIYCFEGEMAGMMRSMGMGMHDANEMAGDHTADFYCTDTQGRQSNHMDVRFTMTRK